MRLLREEVDAVGFVASGDELFDAVVLKMQNKELGKIADGGIITVAVHDFPLEVLFVELQFGFDVGELGIELVFFVGLRHI